MENETALLPDPNFRRCQGAEWERGTSWLARPSVGLSQAALVNGN